VALGFLISLGYADPRLDLYNAFTQFKRHPFIAGIIRDGRVLEQGARTVPVGGTYTLPRLAVDGAVFVGAGAGFHNTLALKGLHVGMKSGMLAAEAIVAACEADRYDAVALDGYPRAVAASWVQTEMSASRNTAQALARRMPAKLVHLAAQQVSGGRGLVDPMPITADSRTLSAVRGDAVPTVPPDAFDGHQVVDKLTGVYLSKTVHREDQPCHLVVHDPDLCIRTCYPTYGAPCTRFCPGDVYEIETDADGRRPRLKLNPANCLHCKTCDVKDPFDNITWTGPEGGEGPGYTVV
jgi:electron-transferring-flavoprotein dehydrogenase